MRRPGGHAVGNNAADEAGRAEAEAAADWTEHEDPGTGKIYYHSPLLQKSVWKEVVVAANRTVHMERNRPDIPSALRGAQDWVEHKDPDTNRFYLHSEELDKSTWKDERGSRSHSRDHGRRKKKVTSTGATRGARNAEDTCDGMCTCASRPNGPHHAANAGNTFGARHGARAGAATGAVENAEEKTIDAAAQMRDTAFDSAPCEFAENYVRGKDGPRRASAYRDVSGKDAESIRDVVAAAAR